MKSSCRTGSRDRALPHPGFQLPGPQAAARTDRDRCSRHSSADGHSQSRNARSLRGRLFSGRRHAGRQASKDGRRRVGLAEDLRYIHLCRVLPPPAEWSSARFSSWVLLEPALLVICLVSGFSLCFGRIFDDATLRTGSFAHSDKTTLINPETGYHGRR
jgi:hypothetical protein